MDADETTDLKNSIIKVYELVVFQHLFSQGMPVSIVTSSQLVASCNLDQRVILVFLPNEMYSKLISTILRQRLNVLRAVIMPKFLIGVKRIGKNGS